MIGHGMRGRLLVVGLGGSLAKVSRSRAALATALAGAASAGAGTQLLDLRELRLPMYDPDDHHPTEAARRLIEACYSADGLLWSSPMYQGTVSGAFKNALDWLHLLGDRDPPIPVRQGHRAHQHRRGNPRIAGGQHDRVRGQGTAGVGGAVRCPGRVGRTSVRCGRRNRRPRGWSSATKAGRGGRSGRREVCGRPGPASAGRVRPGGRTRRLRELAERADRSSRGDFGTTRDREGVRERSGRGRVQRQGLQEGAP
jgi:hypothetical protein